MSLPRYKFMLRDHIILSFRIKNPINARNKHYAHAASAEHGHTADKTRRATEPSDHSETDTCLIYTNHNVDKTFLHDNK